MRKKVGAGLWLSTIQFFSKPASLRFFPHFTKYSRRILSLIERNIFTRKPSNEVSGSAANLSRIKRTRIFYKKKKKKGGRLIWNFTNPRQAVAISRLVTFREWPSAGRESGERSWRYKVYSTGLTRRLSGKFNDRSAESRPFGLKSDQIEGSFAASFPPWKRAKLLSLWEIPAQQPNEYKSLLRRTWIAFLRVRR